MQSSYQRLPVHSLINRAPPPDVIRRQVQQILASSNFDASIRNRKFLQFIVEETLAGHGDRLKGYTIALEVFDRDPSFDPQLDPVVRIEAGRLRRSLERYYLTEGKASAIAISIPKGKYVPQFEIRPRLDARDGSHGDHMSLTITPILDQYANSDDATFDTALIEEIIMEFYDKHKEIGIIIPPVLSENGTIYEASAMAPSTEYILRGSIRRSEHGIRIIFHLADRTTGHLLWTRSFDQEPTTVDMIATPREIAADIVGSVTAVISKSWPGDVVY